MTIRRLGPGDAPTLRRLNAMFGKAFGEPETYESDPPSDAWIERLLARETIVVLATEEGEEIVGGLVAYVLEKFEQARSEIYIYDLAVAEPQRRRGIATALIARLQEIAAEIGAWVIFVQADYGDEPAVALYEGLGTREDVMHFDIPPAEGGKRSDID
ncbi:AAC(3)-I family aminoglycoside N-acetyltransferase [Sphingomonas sp. DT-207]|uniref:AAC(3)-I family aminoglycoside N-acetyltransferase n=1 Tax=Sphingomonas sp. DT-207 TaxID=3396167 RepID=UPI003F1B55CA